MRHVDKIFSGLREYEKIPHPDLAPPQNFLAAFGGQILAKNNSFHLENCEKHIFFRACGELPNHPNSPYLDQSPPLWRAAFQILVSTRMLGEGAPLPSPTREGVGVLYNVMYVGAGGPPTPTPSGREIQTLKIKDF